MFYAIANLKSSVVFEIPEPWNWTKTQIPPAMLAAQDKKEYTAYCHNFGTQHAFFSAVEGLDPRTRVSYGAEGGNPALKIHALVIDYDAPLTPDMIALLLAKPPSEFIPSYISTSFSGNARMVWLFERPVLVATKEQVVAFIQYAQKQLKLTKWGAGMDTVALGNYAVQYYELGRDWRQPFPNAKPIPESHLSLWLYEASKKLKLSSLQYSIPLELVAEEIEKQYPGGWTGPFELGRVGVRFWDPKADNPRGCQIRADGMQCYTGDKAFVNWRELLGPAFVEGFQADRISPIREKTVYDGGKFWYEAAPGIWTGVTKDDFGQFLRVHGFSSSKPKGGASEIDLVEHDIKTHRRVVGAFPFLHHPVGVVVHNNERYLNYSTVKAMDPAPPLADGRMTQEHLMRLCPWLFRFFKDFFEAEATEYGEQTPLLYFYAWLKRFYEGAVNLKPVSGQVMVIAGPTGKGKTLLSRGIVARITGRYEDGSSALVEGSQWTDTMSDASVLGIDDTLASNNAGGHARFTSMMKKLVANTSISFNGKYKQQGTLPWAGRIIVTCNLDPESVKILPNMDLSVLDKIMLLKASDAEKDFPPRDELEATLARELPYFCRWLLDWNYPEAVMSAETRFGVSSYHHRGIHRSALNQGVTQQVLEMLRGLIHMEKGQNPNRTEWRGTTIDLFTLLSAIHSYGMTRMSPVGLGTALGLLQARGFPIAHVDEPGVTEWVIPLDWAALATPVTKRQGNNGSKSAAKEVLDEVRVRN